MNDIEQLNKEMDEELKKSPALKMAFVQIRAMDKRISALEAKKVCGQCGAKVARNEWHLIYTSKYSSEDKENGVCEECWQKHYVPYMKPVNIQ